MGGGPGFFDVGDEQAVAAVVFVHVGLPEDVAGVEGGYGGSGEFAGDVEAAFSGDLETLFD